MARLVCALLPILAVWSAAVLAGPPPAAGWPTNRGNPQRTGNLDDLPGPATPKVLWVYKAAEHFIASPVPGAKAVFVSGLGPFNTAAFHALAIDANAADRVLWSKVSPYVKLPTVCAPAVTEGLLIFGDGMHQTDGAILYCLQADGGRPVWQFPVPGKLVHMEGSPTVEKGRVYIGGGDAGVLCLDLKRLTLDGKELDLPAARKIIEARWAELLAWYEQEKKKDADLAVPPSDEQLPKPAPKLIWQRGKGAWHVDAPVAVHGDKVFVASAYLDEDKVGKRCLLCLKAEDGSVVWEAPLKTNPWGGPTVAGDTVLVACSSIRFDAKQVKDAKGEVVALDLASGQVKWQREIPGGVLSALAVKDDLAIYAGTDGKVVARNAASGERKWTYDAGTPLFAGAALAGGMVYLADLKAVVHALRLEDGGKEWTFDVASDPAVQSPGMVFGSPIVHGGRIYLATCNLEGDSAGQPSAVVCIADASVGVQEEPVPEITVDKAKKVVSVPCRIAPRKLPALKEVYPLEVVAAFPAPMGQKAHETIVTFRNKPSEIHKALEELGLKAGKPARGEGVSAAGPEVRISLELPGIGGRARVIPIEKTMVDRRTGKPMPPLKWHFTGSVLRQPDPYKDYKAYAADLTGTLITLFPVTDETVIQSNLTMRECNLLKLETNKGLLPEEGTTVKLVIEVK